jgi:DNA-binding transcriptional ArsR family regulator
MLSIMKMPRRKSGDGLSREMLERMAQVLRLLAHPRRLRILEILETVEAAPVHAVVGDLGLPQGATSQHLNQMRRAGLIEAERRGKEVWYRIADRRCISILDCIRGKGGKP